jgi:uncharacterized membrane protein
VTAMPSFQRVHVEVTDVVFTWLMSVCVLKAGIVKLTVATCANIDHVVQILFNMVMDITAELHVRVARLFVRGGILYA